jgi:hypothetical protein
VHFAADLGEIGDYDQGVVITDWPIYELEFGNVRKVFFLSKIDKY